MTWKTALPLQSLSRWLGRLGQCQGWGTIARHVPEFGLRLRHSGPVSSIQMRCTTGRHPGLMTHSSWRLFGGLPGTCDTQDKIQTKTLKPHLARTEHRQPPSGLLLPFEPTTTAQLGYLSGFTLQDTCPCVSDLLRRAGTVIIIITKHTAALTRGCCTRARIAHRTLHRHCNIVPGPNFLDHRT